MTLNSDLEVIRVSKSEFSVIKCTREFCLYLSGITMSIPNTSKIYSLRIIIVINIM